MTFRKVFKQLNLISSSDVDVVASDKKTTELYVEATTNGKAPGKSCKIQILGDERAGKTSLRKKLMGERFDPKEPSTFGIDTRFCKVNEIDESWQQRQDETDSEYERVLSWVLAKNLKMWQRKSNNPEETRVQLRQWIVIPVLLLLFLFGLFSVIFLSVFVSSIIPATSFSYFLIVLSATSVVVTKKSDIYRVGVGVAVFVPVVDILLWALFDNENNDENHLASGTLLALWLFSGLLFGWACGFGLRTGLAGGVLLAVTPRSKSLHGVEHANIEVVAETMVGFGCGLLFGICTSSIIPSISSKFLCTKKNTTVSEGLSKFAYIPVILSALLSFCTRYASEISTFSHGLLFGLGAMYGILMGRWFRHNYAFDFEKCCVAFGFCLGIIGGYIGGYKLPLIHDDGLDVFGVALRIFLLISTEVYRRWLTRQNPVPVRLVSDKLARNVETLPTKLSLWDFAGQDFDYNTHHTFVSSDVIYIIVFDLNKFKQPSLRASELNRIKFWLTSVYQHSNSPLFLVGTHLDCINSDDLEDIRQYLEDKLLSHGYSFLHKLVVNEALPFFCVDNSGTLDLSSSTLSMLKKDDMTHLREAIRRESEHAKPMNHEYPIRWRRFLDFIKPKDSSSSSDSNSEMPFISLTNLKTNTDDFGFSDAREINEMLRFFSASGEILYDHVDSILRQIVIHQPQFIVDIMEATVALPESSTLGALSWAVKLLKNTGTMDYSLAKLLITRRVPVIDDSNFAIVLAMLEAKDLICKVACRSEIGVGTNDLFVVPSMLPSVQSFPLVEVAWDVKYYIDVGPLLPEAVLFRLMTRCSSHSDLISQGKDQSVLFREGGLFTLGTQFFFMLRKQQPCATQELVEILVKAVPESNPVGVLYYLHKILETVRCRDFPRLQYGIGVKCPHPAPHQGCRTADMWHILHLCGNGDVSFPEQPRAHGLCNGRQIDVDIDESIPANPTYTDDQPMVVNIQGNNNYVVIAGRNARVSIHRDTTTTPVGHDGGNAYEIIPDVGEIDIYISSSPRDEGWIQEILVRYLSAPPNKMQVCTNLYDTPSRPNHVLSMKEIDICRVFLVVCSKHYKRDLTGRLRYEREVARQRQIPLVVVAIGDVARPDDLFDSEVVIFSNDSNQMSSDTLVSIVQKLIGGPENVDVQYK